MKNLVMRKKIQKSDFQQYINAITSKSEKFAVALLAGLALSGGLVTTINASNITDQNNTVTMISFREVTAGANGRVRGRTTVQANSANLNAIRGQVVVTSRNPNGTVHSTQSSGWAQSQAGGNANLGVGASVQTVLLSGATNSGTTIHDSQIRHSSNGLWFDAFSRVR